MLTSRKYTPSSCVSNSTSLVSMEDTFCTRSLYPRWVRCSLSTNKLFSVEYNQVKTYSALHSIGPSSSDASSRAQRLSFSPTRSSMGSNKDTSRLIARPWLTFVTPSLWKVDSRQKARPSEESHLLFPTGPAFLQRWDLLFKSCDSALCSCICSLKAIYLCTIVRRTGG